ncbi:hypothetical protein JD276_12460 [Leucobacter sp. CSA1]|uniref:Uncharacterized protein n=1 Tax=Leucobacter chromiisoli TaxID=2796471 RepID=A0A934QAP8_9MICO|nr:hypothetical protein [Leucobacter chromiisoli]MBK0419847.1 hypothetical protein [Leucobacter chromiisoli]
MLDSVTQGAQLAPEPPTAEDIRLDPLSEREWRVIDRRMRAQDAPSVLGFIEKVGNTYETLAIRDGCARWSFRDLREALALFAGGGAERP